MFVMNEKIVIINSHCIIVFNINIVNKDPPLFFSQILQTIQALFQVINKNILSKICGELARDFSIFSDAKSFMILPAMALLS